MTVQMQVQVSDIKHLMQILHELLTLPLVIDPYHQILLGNVIRLYDTVLFLIIQRVHIMLQFDMVLFQTQLQLIITLLFDTKHLNSLLLEEIRQLGRYLQMPILLVVKILQCEGVLCQLIQRDPKVQQFDLAHYLQIRQVIITQRLVGIRSIQIQPVLIIHLFEETLSKLIQQGVIIQLLVVMLLMQQLQHLEIQQYDIKHFELKLHEVIMQQLVYMLLMQVLRGQIMFEYDMMLYDSLQLDEIIQLLVKMLVITLQQVVVIL